MDFNPSDRRLKQKSKSKGLSNERRQSLLRDRCKQQLPILKKIKTARSLNKALLNFPYFDSMQLKDPLKKIPSGKKLVKESYFGVPQHLGEKPRPIQKKFDIYALTDGLPHLPKPSKEINNHEQVYTKKKVTSETLPELLNKKNIIKSSFYKSDKNQPVSNLGSLC